MKRKYTLEICPLSKDILQILWQTCTSSKICHVIPNVISKAGFHCLIFGTRKRNSIASALVSLDAIIKLVHPHLTIEHSEDYHWRKYPTETHIWETHVFEHKAFWKIKKLLQKRDLGPDKRIWDANSCLVKNFHRTLDNPSQQTSPAVGNEWALCASLCSDYTLSFLRVKW